MRKALFPHSKNFKFLLRFSFIFSFIFWIFYSLIYKIGWGIHKEVSISFQSNHLSPFWGALQTLLILNDVDRDKGKRPQEPIFGNFLTPTASQNSQIWAPEAISPYPSWLWENKSFTIGTVFLTPKKGKWIEQMPIECKTVMIFKLDFQAICLFCILNYSYNPFPLLFN